MTDVCFFTVCGGGEDYEFLLGSIRHHAKMGRHVVLDTTPSNMAAIPNNLPDSVLWVHEPFFGSGWKEFDSLGAVRRAFQIAKWSKPDVIVYLDSDEFFTLESALLFDLGKKNMISVETHHWRRDWKLQRFGQSERHFRIWPGDLDVHFPVSEWWKHHPDYDGNPNRHPAAAPPAGHEIFHAEGPFHNHLHYALGEKSLDESTAAATIAGWPDGTSVALVELPDLIARWRVDGILPSEDFS